MVLQAELILRVITLSWSCLNFSIDGMGPFKFNNNENTESCKTPICFLYRFYNAGSTKAVNPLELKITTYITNITYITNLTSFQTFTFRSYHNSASSDAHTFYFFRSSDLQLLQIFRDGSNLLQTTLKQSGILC